MRPTRPRVRTRAAAILLVGLFALEGCAPADAPTPGASGPGPSPSPAPSAATASADASLVAAASPSDAASATAPIESSEALPPDVGQARLDVTAGDAVATKVITPWDGGAVTGKTADGTVYSLRIAPGALTEPTEISLRPLTGTTDLGPIVAGAAFEPAGTVFALPAILTIRGPGVRTTDSTATFDYRGAPADGPAQLRILPEQDGTQVTLLVQHFSGSVAVDVGKDANALYEKWAAAGGGDTARGRQAAAETRYAAADLAAKQGRISEETAQGIKDRALQEWYDAEHDILVSDSDITRMAQGGKPKDAAKLKAELAKVADVTTRTNAGNGKLGLNDVLEIIADYQAAIVKTINTDPAFNKAVDSGLESDAAVIEEALGLLLFLERDIALLGGTSKTNALAETAKVVQRVEDALLRRCKTPDTTPINPQRLIGIQRMLSLIGTGRSGATFECVFPSGIPSATPAPAVAANGKVHVTMTVNYEWGDDVLDADLTVVLRQSPKTGKLVFASGSTMDLKYVSPEPPCHIDCGAGPVCPNLVAGVTERGLSVGSPGEDGADPASAPNPAILGEVIGGLDGGPLKLAVGVPAFGSGDCTWGMVPLMCPQEGYLVGNLVGANPREWSFACSVPGNGYSISTGGRVLGG